MPSTLSRENLQRVGVLAFLPSLLKRLGADPSKVLAEAGLPADALDDPETTIPFAAMGLVLYSAAEMTNCPHFGLELGRHIQTRSLGMVGELMRNAPTLRAALQSFALNQHRNAHGSVVYLTEDADHAFFGYAVYQSGVRGNDLLCDAVALGGVNLITELTGVSPDVLHEVHFSRAEPQDLSRYQQLFGTRLCFNSEQTAVAFPRRLLDRPVPGADAVYRSILERRIRSVWHAGDLDTGTKLRRALRTELLKGSVSAASIASEMGMSRRTMDRRLEALGISFQDVLDETRCAFAQQLLADTRLRIGHISMIVGYADPSVLTRGFTRWTGMTPTEWRASMAAPLS